MGEALGSETDSQGNLNALEQLESKNGGNAKARTIQEGIKGGYACLTYIQSLISSTRFFCS